VINLSVYFKGPQTSGVWGGRRYSIAREVNALGLYYNADLFKAKGLDPDNPPKTWSEVRAAAEKLTDPSKHVFGIGFCAHGSEQSTFQFLPWLWQAGGSINKPDAPEAIEALQYWTDLVQKGYASKDVINQQQNDVKSVAAGNYAMAAGAAAHPKGRCSTNASRAAGQVGEHPGSPLGGSISRSKGALNDARSARSSSCRRRRFSGRVEVWTMAPHGRRVKDPPYRGVRSVSRRQRRAISAAQSA
jgi:hypothetical protein